MVKSMSPVSNTQLLADGPYARRTFLLFYPLGLVLGGKQCAIDRQWPVSAWLPVFTLAPHHWRALRSMQSCKSV
eukprot:5577053-Pleurochrysis_carterae.AAC.1